MNVVCYPLTVRGIRMLGRDSMALIMVCLLDTILTAILISMGMASEANPLPAFFLQYGIPAFCLFKVGTLVPLIALAESYRKVNPVFVGRSLWMGTAGYLAVYFFSVFMVNCR